MINKIILVVLIAFVFIFSIGISYAQSIQVADIPVALPALPITVKTDKNSYSDGETIIVSGTVRDPGPFNSVSVVIRAPNGNVVTVGQISLSPVNTFYVTVNPGGDLWEQAGKYEVTAQYGNRSANSSFEFGGYFPFEKIAIEGTHSTILYKVTGGQLLKISPDTSSKSLVLSIKAIDTGSLTIVLPKSVIDSQSNGKNAPFSVVVDGKKADHKEQASASGRTITISFEKEANKIVILGTSVIPEFGSMSALILATAILSIILLSSRVGRVLNRA